MPIRKYTIDPPFVHAEGDTYVREPGIIRQIRGGIEIDTRAVSDGSLLTAQAHVGGSEVTAFYEEFNMPGVMATLTEVVVEENGAHHYKFGDGTTRDFNSRALAYADVEYLDTDSSTPKDFLILQSLRKDNNGSNPGCMEGQSCTVDCAALSPCAMSQGIGVS